MKIRFLGVALAATVALGATAPALAQEQTRTITVSGDSSAVVPNDQARFVFGVQTARPTAQAALLATSNTIRRVISRVGAAGVAGADVETSTISLSRVSRPVSPGSGRRVVEYQAFESVRVTVRSVRSAGRVVDAAVGGGATSVGGPAFSPSNVGDVYKRTLVAAFREARDKAERLAAEAGVRLGAPVSIREGTVAEPVPAGSLPDTVNRQARGRTTPVRPGTTRVTADVVVVFSIS
jgi:uncharacterized protein YggE